MPLELFQQYALGDGDPVCHAQLVDIGNKISHKLKVSPLAAKTVGGALSSDMRAKYWSIVMANGFWSLGKVHEAVSDSRPSYQYRELGLSTSSS
jgi:hypothetical protein